MVAVGSGQEEESKMHPKFCSRVMGSPRCCRQNERLGKALVWRERACVSKRADGFLVSSDCPGRRSPLRSCECGIWLFKEDRAKDKDLGISWIVA